MKRAVMWCVPGILCLLIAGWARIAAADTIYFKNGTSTWVEEANVEEKEVVATRGGQTFRFPLAEVDRVEKKRTNMPSYRVDAPPPVPPSPVSGPGGPGAPGAPAGVPAPGEPGSPGAVPPPGAPGSAQGSPPGAEASGPPTAGQPGSTPAGQPPGGTSPPGGGQRGQIPIPGSGGQRY